MEMRNTRTLTPEEIAECRKFWGPTWRPRLEITTDTFGRSEKRSVAYEGYPPQEKPTALMEQAMTPTCRMPGCAGNRTLGYSTCPNCRRYEYLFDEDGELRPDAQAPEPDSL